ELFLLEPLAEFVQEAGLPGPGLRDDADRLPVANRRPPEETLQKPQSESSADERSRRGIAGLPPWPPVTAKMEGRPGTAGCRRHRLELESSSEKLRSGRAANERRGLGRAQHGLQHCLRLPAMGLVHHERAIGASDRDLACVDGDSSGCRLADGDGSVS